MVKKVRLNILEHGDYVVLVLAGNGHVLQRDILRDRIMKSKDPRALIANEAQYLFNHWELEFGRFMTGSVDKVMEEIFHA